MSDNFTIRDNNFADTGKPASSALAVESIKLPIYASRFNPEQLEQYCLLQNKLKEAGLSSTLFEADVDALQKGASANQIITMRITEEAIALIYDKCDVFKQAEFGEETHLGKLNMLVQMLPPELSGSPISNSGILLLNADHDPYRNGHSTPALGQPGYAKIKSWAQEFSPLELLAEAHKCLDKNVVAVTDILKPKSDLVRSGMAQEDVSFSHTIKLHDRLGLKRAKPALGADDATIAKNFASFAEKFKNGAQSEAVVMLEPEAAEGRNLLALNLTIGTNIKAMLAMSHEDFDRHAAAVNLNNIELRDNLQSALSRIRSNLSKIGSAILKEGESPELLETKFSTHERDILLGLNKKLDETALLHPEKAEEIKSKKLHPIADELLQEAFSLKATKTTHHFDQVALTAMVTLAIT